MIDDSSTAAWVSNTTAFARIRGLVLSLQSPRPAPWIAAAAGEDIETTRDLLEALEGSNAVRRVEDVRGLEETWFEPVSVPDCAAEVRRARHRSWCY